MTDLPCINPVCTHLFTAQEVTRAAVLKCPRCGQEIQVRTGGASGTASSGSAVPSKPASPPKKTPVATPAPRIASPVKTPLAKPAATAPPVAKSAPPKPVPPPAPSAPRAAAPQPIEPRPVSPFAASPLQPEIPAGHDPLADLDTLSTGRTTISARPARRGWSYLTVFAIGFILLGGLLAVFLGIRRFRGENENGAKYAGAIKTVPYTVFNFEKTKEVVFSVVVPSESDWVASHDFDKKLTLIAEWHEKSKDVWLGVAAADFGLYKPREAEMIRTGMDQLNASFGETLEMEQLPKASKVAGKPAKKLEFKGRDGAVIRWGEMHLFSHRGVAFWVYVLGPDLETCQGVLDWLEERDLGVTVAKDMRKGWREQPPRMESFASISGMVSLAVPHGIYEKNKAPKDPSIDIPSDLYLLGRYRKEKDNRKNAHVQVYQLEPQPNLEEAMKRAKARVVALASAGGATGYKLVVSPDAEDASEFGKESALGGRTGRIGDFCMLVDDRRERYYAVAVVNDPDRLYVIACDVVWDNRQIWQQDFHDLIKTVKIQKGKTAE